MSLLSFHLQARVESRKVEGDWRGLPVYELAWGQDDGTNGIQLFKLPMPMIIV